MNDITIKLREKSVNKEEVPYKIRPIGKHYPFAS